MVVIGKSVSRLPVGLSPLKFHNSKFAGIAFHRCLDSLIPDLSIFNGGSRDFETPDISHFQFLQFSCEIQLVIYVRTGG